MPSRRAQARASYRNSVFREVQIKVRAVYPRLVLLVAGTLPDLIYRRGGGAAVWSPPDLYRDRPPTDIFHVGVSRAAVEVEVVLLRILSRVALTVGQSEGPILGRSLATCPDRSLISRGQDAPNREAGFELAHEARTLER